MKKVYITAGIFLIAISIIAAQFVEPGYKPIENDIIFSHDFHVNEQEMACEDCHLELEESTISSQHNVPTMDECAACHDVEDDCGMCHTDGDEPLEAVVPDREILFNHSLHLGMELKCLDCHQNVYSSENKSINNYPDKKICMSCHDDKKASSDCSLCHGGGADLKYIHPDGWLNDHAVEALSNDKFCSKCHIEKRICLDCHRGYNPTGSIHELNYYFTHGLDAKSDTKNCLVCHNTEKFCSDCHEQNNRIPLNHSRLNWSNNHGEAARTDVENCAACHQTDDMTCARGGCHSDFDGILGTNPPIHKDDASIFDVEGSWHDNDNAYCYQCHIRSNKNQNGFCNYCHDYED